MPGRAGEPEPSTERWPKTMPVVASPELMAPKLPEKLNDDDVTNDEEVVLPNEKEGGAINSDEPSWV